MIQVFDESGNTIFDASSRCVKFIGTLFIGSSYTGAAQSGSITVPEWAAYPNNTPFFARTDGGWSTDGYDAIVTISGSTLNWQYPIADAFYFNGYYQHRPNTTFVYGLF